MVEDPDIMEDPGEYIQEVETTSYPWYIREIKKFHLGSKLKMLMLILLTFVGIYFMFKWFGWYCLLGLIPAPAWYFWALRQIDRESYMVIEIRIKGDEYSKGKRSPDTQTNIYSIPPDIWNTIQKKGSPFYAGSRIYICDYVDHDPDTGEMVIYFADYRELSNVNFYAKAELWLETKRKIPELQKELAVFKYNNRILAMDKATEMLETFGLIEDRMLGKGGTRRMKREGVKS